MNETNTLLKKNNFELNYILFKKFPYLLRLIFKTTTFQMHLRNVVLTILLNYQDITTETMVWPFGKPLARLLVKSLIFSIKVMMT